MDPFGWRILVTTRLPRESRATPLVDIVPLIIGRPLVVASRRCAEDNDRAESDLRSKGTLSISPAGETLPGTSRDHGFSGWRASENRGYRTTFDFFFSTRTHAYESHMVDSIAESAMGKHQTNPSRSSSAALRLPDRPPSPSRFRARDRRSERNSPLRGDRCRWASPSGRRRDCRSQKGARESDGRGREKP